MKACTLIFVCLLDLTGCTVTPTVVDSKAPSFDGNAQDSGFKGWLPDGSGLISAAAHDRYVGLVKLYGDAFVPVLVKDEGLTLRSDGLWRIDQEHLARFGEMAKLRRMGSSSQPP